MRADGRLHSAPVCIEWRPPERKALTDEIWAGDVTAGRRGGRRRDKVNSDN